MENEAQSRAELRRHAQIGKNVGYLLHQARSPAVTIGLLARSLRKKGCLSEDARREAGQIIDQAMILETMLRDCMDYLRPSGRGRERINVGNLLERVATAIKAESEQAGVPVTVEVAKHIPAMLGHRRMLGQALLNVARNALEAAADDEGTVTLAAHTTRKSVILRVADTGKGMSPESVQRALEPFYSGKKGGTGLGLPFTANIVKEHGGHISIKSAQGEGTQVTIRFSVGASPESGNAQKVRT